NSDRYRRRGRSSGKALYIFVKPGKPSAHRYRGSAGDAERQLGTERKNSGLLSNEGLSLLPILRTILSAVTCRCFGTKSKGVGNLSQFSEGGKRVCSAA